MTVAYAVEFRIKYGTKAGERGVVYIDVADGPRGNLRAGRKAKRQLAKSHGVLFVDDVRRLGAP